VVLLATTAVAAMDVLAPGIGEIIGGRQREERLDVLDARMAERGTDKERYAWYRDLRRNRAARRVWPGVRAHACVCHGAGQCARPDPISADAGECEVLRVDSLCAARSSALVVCTDPGELV
jgi:hypothetical protein